MELTERDLPFQNAQKMYEGRLLKGAVPEAANARRFLCNQHCGTHLFDLYGVPHEQLTGEKHDCPTTRLAKMWTAHLNMIMISRVRAATIQTLEDVLANQEKWNKRWNIAWEKWKKTGKIPRTKEVEGWIID